MRLPHFAHMDSKPFHPDTYVEPEPEADAGTEKDRSLSIKLQVDSTIRWRWTKDAQGKDVSTHINLHVAAG